MFSKEELSFPKVFKARNNYLTNLNLTLRTFEFQNDKATYKFLFCRLEKAFPRTELSKRKEIGYIFVLQIEKSFTRNRAFES